MGSGRLSGREAGHFWGYMGGGELRRRQNKLISGAMAGLLTRLLLHKLGWVGSSQRTSPPSGRGWGRSEGEKGGGVVVEVSGRGGVRVGRG